MVTDGEQERAQLLASARADDWQVVMSCSSLIDDHRRGLACGLVMGIGRDTADGAVRHGLVLTESSWLSWSTLTEVVAAVDPGRRATRGPPSSLCC